MGKDNKYDAKYMIKCADKLYELECPLIMGVLNITPDSFYEKSRMQDTPNWMEKVKNRVDAGAQIIDVGGVSTRPGADLLSSKEEIERIIPVIKSLRIEFPHLLISVDTFRADVAKKAVENGADIINDVYGGRYDDSMFDTVAELKVPYVLMHSRGEAKNMQDLCEYDDVVEEVVLELSESISQLRAKGVKDIIVDPGFGFAKNLEQNYELFKNLNLLEVLECPILIGVSRKSMIYKLFDSSPEKALNGTTVLNTIGLQNSAAIIRVHDVEEAFEARQIVEKMKN